MMQETYIPQEILLIKNGELALKGLNRRTFEEALMSNLRYRLRRHGDFLLRRAQSTIYIEPKNDYVDMEGACDAVSRVFGIAAFSRARVTVKDMAAIQQQRFIQIMADIHRADHKISFLVQTEKRG